MQARQERALDLERQLHLVQRQQQQAQSAGAAGGRGRRNRGNADSTTTTTEQQVNRLRVPLCEVLADMMLTDPALALQWDVDNRLWKHCFYSRIVPQRNRIAKAQRKLQQLPQPPPATSPSPSSSTPYTMAKEALAQLEHSLNYFLAEAVTLYQYMVDNLQSKLVGHYQQLQLSSSPVVGAGGRTSPSPVSSSELTNPSPPLENDNHEDGNVVEGMVIQPEDDDEDDQEDDDDDGGMETDLSPAPPLTSTKGMVELIHKLYIRLGDLFRYSGQWAKAQQAYETAAWLGPGQGHALNQLAVICQVVQEPSPTATVPHGGDGMGPPLASSSMSPLSAVALYWYARSLCAATQPFETARSNLTRLFRDNQEWLQKYQQTTKSHSLPHNNTNNNHTSSANSTGGSSCGSQPQHQFQQRKQPISTRQFLAEFVDLHRLFFVAKESTTLYKTMEKVMDRFQSLLLVSAFGDALLCKFICIQAFSEQQHHQNNPNNASSSSTSAGTKRSGTPKKRSHSNSTTNQGHSSTPNVFAWAARTATLQMGCKIAEKVLVAALQKQPPAQGTTSSNSSQTSTSGPKHRHKKKQHSSSVAASSQMSQQSQMPSPTQHSVRLLLPLLLLTEYVSSVPVGGGGGGSDDISSSSKAEQRHQDASQAFWERMVQVWNHVAQNYSTTTNPEDDPCEKTTFGEGLPKEYEQWIGFTPFSSFIPMELESGFVSDERALAHFSSGSAASDKSGKATMTTSATTGPSPPRLQTILIRRILTVAHSVTRNHAQITLVRGNHGRPASKEANAARAVEVRHEEMDYDCIAEGCLWEWNHQAPNGRPTTRRTAAKTLPNDDDHNHHSPMCLELEDNDDKDDPCMMLEEEKEEAHCVVAAAGASVSAANQDYTPSKRKNKTRSMISPHQHEQQQTRKPPPPGEDVLVYQPGPFEGSPALLVPGALLMCHDKDSQKNNKNENDESRSHHGTKPAVSTRVTASGHQINPASLHLDSHEDAKEEEETNLKETNLDPSHIGRLTPSRPRSDEGLLAPEVTFTSAVTTVSSPKPPPPPGFGPPPGFAGGAKQEAAVANTATTRSATVPPADASVFGGDGLLPSHATTPTGHHGGGSTGIRDDWMTSPSLSFGLGTTAAGLPFPSSHASSSLWLGGGGGVGGMTVGQVLGSLPLPPTANPFATKTMTMSTTPLTLTTTTTNADPHNHRWTSLSDTNLEDQQQPQQPPLSSLSNPLSFLDSLATSHNGSGIGMDIVGGGFRTSSSLVRSPNATTTSMTAEGTSLLDSGILSSLWMQDSSPPAPSSQTNAKQTQNPFAYY